jgi:hypothetical protein
VHFADRLREAAQRCRDLRARFRPSPLTGDLDRTLRALAATLERRLADARSAHA